MEFQVECFPSSEDATAYMIESFAKNPIAVEYDPDEWLARLRAGAPPFDFLTRQSDEPISPIRGIFAEIVSPQG